MENANKSVADKIRKHKLGICILTFIIVLIIIYPFAKKHYIQSCNLKATETIRSLTHAQESLFVETESYTTDIEDLKPYDFHKPDKINITIIIEKGRESQPYMVKAYHENGDRTYSITAPHQTGCCL